MASLEPPQNKTWDLSLYELNRTPQTAITDNSEIAVSPRSLHSELMCPICLDMLKKTMTTKECLHRFCSDCIITALRSGNKECPTCRKKLVSKRSLRPDPNFDLLISKIYPSREEYEAHQERVLAKFNQSHSQASMVNSITEGIKLQSQNRPNRSRKMNDLEMGGGSSNGGGGGGRFENGNNGHSNGMSTAAIAAAAANAATVAAAAAAALAVANGNSAANGGSGAMTNGGSSTATMGHNNNSNSSSAAMSADGHTARETSSSNASESNTRHTSNPPSVRSTPSPVPSNFSSATSNKYKRGRSILTSERSEERSEESESNSEVEGSRTEGNDSNLDTEGEGGGSELGLNDEIELVFKPHPTEMAADNPLVKALKENSIRYLKTTANASGEYLRRYLGNLNDR